MDISTIANDTLLSQKKTNNFAHDALRELCIEFYYNRSEGLAAQFPDEFYVLPSEALCLAATCVCFVYLI